MNDEIRWYEGKYKVRIVQKSNMKDKHGLRVLVEALEEVVIKGDPNMLDYPKIIERGEKFVTVPRLLWKRKRR